MPVANQYGVDMGNILSTVSDLKTAQQNRETNSLKQDILSRQNEKDIKTDQAEQDFIKDPAHAVANTIAQQVQFNDMKDQDKKRAVDAMQQVTNKHGVAVNSIIGIQDPDQQKQAVSDYFNSLSPEEQKITSSKYGSTPEQLQQNLPHIMNDLIVQYKGISYLADEANDKQKEQTKQENALALEDKKGDNALTLEDVRGKNALNVVDKKGQNSLAVEGLKSKTSLGVANINAGVRRQLASMSSDKQSNLVRKANALVDGGYADNINEGILMVMKNEKITNVQDPTFGNKKIQSSNTFGSQPSGNLKPLNINNYIK